MATKTDPEARLRIALDGIAYSAFRNRWGEVELRARRALEIARG